MSTKRILLCASTLALLVAFAGMAAAQLDNQEQLGKKLFFDSELSTPPGQACAACHAPEVGFTGPDSATNAAGAVYEGAVTERFGNRKPPSAAYAGDSPILHNTDGFFTGGMFWDGRATGLTLGDPLAEQAQGPFLNPLEQNNPNAKKVVETVLKSDYKDLFNEVCTDSAKYYECIARSIAAYERSNEVSSFTSRYDAYLGGGGVLTENEKAGLALFEGARAKCANCHVTGRNSTFTDFTYDNLGVPKNPDNPFYSMPKKWNPAGSGWVDMGLGGFLNGFMPVYAAENYGKHKVPTLRNVAKYSCEAADDPQQGVNCIIKAYGHNGYFKSLREIVHFYNTRDVPEEGWPAPEVSMNMNTAEVGNLGLSDEEESLIVDFLKTLSDNS